MNRAATKITLLNRQRGVDFDLPTLRALVLAAATPSFGAAKVRSPLRMLVGVEISLVSDTAIAKVHRRFFNDPTPTDVITFPYGEILIGAGTVAKQAIRYQHSPTHEAALCAIHGMLHLGGYDDHAAREAAMMARLQERLLKAAVKLVSSHP